MSENWLAARPILAIVVVFAAVLLVAGLLASAGQAQILSPGPEQAAENFVSALGAHRYTGAMGQLSQELRQQVSEDDLKGIVQALEGSSRKGIQDAHGVDSQQQGNAATARVQVKFGSSQEQELEFSLLMKNGVWRLASIDPVRSLAGSPE